MADWKLHLRLSLSLAMSLLVSSLALLAACGDKESSATSTKGNGDAVTQYVVLGDPLSLIRGATFSPKSPWTEANIQNFKTYSLMSGYQISEKAVKVSDGDPDLEKENAAPKTTQLNADPSVFVKPLQTGAWEIAVAHDRIRLLFQKQADGSVQIAKVMVKDQNLQFQVLHWSKSQDERTVSVLLRGFSETQGKFLLAYYFEKKGTPRAMPAASVLYQYHGGPGVPMGWDQSKTLKLEFCGLGNTAAADMVVPQWTEALKDRLNVEYEKAETFAPFSDLNQHCIYVIDGYGPEQRESAATFGSTFSVINSVQGQMVDSDVFIYTAEFEKLRRSLQNASYDTAATEQKIQTEWQRTFIHELGHVFGLAHKSDGTESIMSYEKNIPNALSTYDVEAIQALYPLLK